MGIFPPLTEFYKKVADDSRIGVTHISLYMALLQQWNIAGGKNPVAIERLPIMKTAKITGRNTYNKCMNDLNNFGYIIYKPSVNIYSTSIVYLNGIDLCVK